MKFFVAVFTLILLTSTPILVDGNDHMLRYWNDCKEHMFLYWNDCKEVKIILPNEVPPFHTLQGWASRTRESLSLPYQVHCIGRYAKTGDSYIIYGLLHKPTVLLLRSCIEGKSKFWQYEYTTIPIRISQKEAEKAINRYLREWEKPYSFGTFCVKDPIPEWSIGLWTEELGGNKGY